MSLISTFSWAIALLTSAACSGVKTRVCSYLGCFLAYAQVTLIAIIRKVSRDLPKSHVKLLSDFIKSLIRLLLPSQCCKTTSQIVIGNATAMPTGT